jgi:hypothetical protein
VDWTGYAAAQGLDRVYRWNPAGKALARVSLGKAWGALNAPAWAPPPAQVPGRMLVPEAGAFLVEGSQGAWWLPLPALPLAPVR